MKWIIFLSCCVTANLFALDPPAPFQGVPSITGKGFKMGAGGYTYSFTLPEGWGIGEMQASKDGSALFRLFPVNQGFGASIEIKKFGSVDDLKAEIARLKKTFNNVSEREDGFEVDLPEAFYLCQSTKDQLVQFWYSIPGKCDGNRKAWDSLKSSLAIASTNQNSTPNAFVSLEEEMFKGWICHHPLNKLHVRFDCYPRYRCTPNKNPDFNYLLEFNGFGAFGASGFYYVKWDQTNLDTQAAFQAHLDEMLKDVNAKAPKQRFSQDPICYQKDGICIWKGNPYTLISLSGDGFLFGFAVKTPSVGSFDLNELIRLVKWWDDK